MSRYDIYALFFPDSCLVCGAYLKPQVYICDRCRPSFAVERNLNIKALKEQRFLKVLSALPNTGHTAKCMLRLKYHGKTAYARKFMGAAFQLIDDKILAGYDAVTFVPMLPANRWKRGYNQAELLARALAKRLNLPCLPLLNKKKDGAAQHSLSRKGRKENAKGAFEPACDRIGQNIIIVDDIITTGATMTQCALALYKGGARQVLGVCAVDTPEGRVGYCPKGVLDTARRACWTLARRACWVNREKTERNGNAYAFIRYCCGFWNQYNPDCIVWKRVGN